MYCLPKYRLSCFTFLLIGLVFAINLLTAQTVPSYTVTFDLGAEGTLINGDLSQTVNKGGTAIAPEFSVAENFAFIGWDKSYHDLSEDLIVTAQYLNASLVGFLESKEIASDGAAYDNFGRSVSISGDTAVIGAYKDNNSGPNSSSVYVLVRSGDGWTEQAKLRASDGVAEDWFGHSVSVSGGTAVIGAYKDDDNGYNSGSAYVFVRNEGVWTEQAKLIATDGAAEDWFGFQVSISGDTVLIGAHGDDDSGGRTGSAYVFVRIGDTWIQQAKLKASDGALGGSVSVSGNKALIGAAGDDDKGNNSGSAYVFERIGSNWVEQAKLTASDGAEGDNFGSSVSISGDTALIGASGDNYNGGYSGSAYVFVRNGSSWVEQAKMIPSDGATGDSFGFSVSVSGDTAVIGAYKNDDNGSDSGSAYVFVRNQDSWSEQAKLNASDGSIWDEFGRSVSVSGNISVIGAYWDDDNGTSSGSAYFYDFGAAPFSVTFDLDGKGAHIGGGALNQIVAANTAAISPAVSGNPGWYFTGWDVAFDNIIGDLVVTAQYVPAYSVTFDLGELGSLQRGELIQDVGVGYPAIAPIVTGNSGWLFIGWDVAFDNIISDLTVTAQYVPTYTVTFELGAQGSLLYGDLVQQVGEGFAAITPMVTVSSGWYLTGWDVAFDNISSDLTITAQYEPAYTVTFDLGARSTLLSGDLIQYVGEGNAAIAPEFSVAENFAFIGWDKSYHNVTQDLVVTAQYVDASLAGVLARKEITSDGKEGGRYGYSVSISGDTCLIGSDNTVYAFVRNGNSWIEQAQLIPRGSSIDSSFGRSLSIHGDTALIGAYLDDDLGSVYVFVRNGDSWSEQAKLIASDGVVADGFGYRVSVSGDIALIGAPQDNDNGTASGSAYVFIRSGGIWHEQAKLTASDGEAEDEFGKTVNMSGNTALIGACGDDDQGSNAGSAYVFVHSEGNWVEQAKLTASDGAEGDNFGNSVSMSGDTALIGARYDDDKGTSSGSAYVFVRNGSGWTEQAKLTASDGRGTSTSTSRYGIVSVWRGDAFGSYVSLSGDVAVILAYRALLPEVFNDGNGTFYRKAYIFVRSGDSWTEQTNFQTSDSYAHQSHSSVSVSGDMALLGFAGLESPNFYDLGVAPFSVTFDLAGRGSHVGGGALTQTVVASDSAIAPLVEGNAGWYFTGWDVAFNNITHDLIVTAQYVPAYTVTFDLGTTGDLLSGDLIQTVKEGGTPVVPEFSVATGSSFIGWDKSYSNITGDIVITAQYLDESLVDIEESITNGNASSISVSGDTVLIGNSGDSVDVLVRNEAGWAKQASLTTSDVVKYFGISVSLSGDIAVVGAQGYGCVNCYGTAYVFVRTGDTWNLQAKLIASDPVIDNEFGRSVSISGDTILVGACGSSSVYVYERQGITWVEQAKITVDDGITDDKFGFSVSLSGDTALIGAYGGPNGYIYRGVKGAAYVFVRNGSSWERQAKLYGSYGDISVGYSVSVSGDTALVSAHGHLGLTGNQGNISPDVVSGRTYVFVRDGNRWTQQAELAASDSAKIRSFGTNVSLSGDLAVIGARDPVNHSTGSAYLFIRSEGVWREEAKFTASEFNRDDKFGQSLNVNGDTVVVGAYNAGEVYFYDFEPAVHNVTFDLGTEGALITGELTQTIPKGGTAIAPEFSVADGWAFIGWDSSFTNVTEDLTVTAQYMLDLTAPDTDTDGMIDGWEMTYFGSVNASDGLSDWDGDGMLDVDEFASGHDPNDGSDFFHVVNLSFIQGLQEVTLTFTSSDNHPNRRYHIFYSDELINPVWTASPLGPIIPDAGDRTTRVFTLPVVAPNRMFFKVDCSLE